MAGLLRSSVLWKKSVSWAVAGGEDSSTDPVLELVMMDMKVDLESCLSVTSPAFL